MSSSLSSDRVDRDSASLWQRLTPYLFLLPALLMLTLTVFYPALQAFYLSFTEYGFDITQPPQWVGLENFQRLLGDRTFWQTLRNTFIYLIGVVPILVFVPLGLAILVNQTLPGIQWFRAAYYAPVIISMVVAGIAWRWLYSETGLFNQFLRWLHGMLWSGLYSEMGILRLVNQFLRGSHLSHEDISWLTSPQWLNAFREGIPWLTSPQLALFSVMAVTVWKGLGYYMVIYLAGLQSIPADLYEAGAIDGSDGWRKHLDITIPLMRPYLFLVGVISAISATKVFEEVYIMTQGGPRSSSKTLVYYVYESAFTDLEISYACTIGLAMFLLILVLSLLRLAVSRQPANVQF